MDINDYIVERMDELVAMHKQEVLDALKAHEPKVSEDGSKLILGEGLSAHAVVRDIMGEIKSHDYFFPYKGHYSAYAAGIWEFSDALRHTVIMDDGTFRLTSPGPTSSWTSRKYSLTQISERLPEYIRWKAYEYLVSYLFDKERESQLLGKCVLVEVKEYVHKTVDEGTKQRITFGMDGWCSFDGRVQELSGRGRNTRTIVKYIPALDKVYVPLEVAIDCYASGKESPEVVNLYEPTDFVRECAALAVLKGKCVRQVTFPKGTRPLDALIINK